MHRPQIQQLGQTVLNEFNLIFSPTSESICNHNSLSSDYNSPDLLIFSSLEQLRQCGDTSWLLPPRSQGFHSASHMIISSVQKQNHNFDLLKPISIKQCSARWGNQTGIPLGTRGPSYLGKLMIGNLPYSQVTVNSVTNSKIISCSENVNAMGESALQTKYYFKTYNTFQTRNTIENMSCYPPKHWKNTI